MPQEITSDDVDRALIPTTDRWQISDTLAPGLCLRAGKSAAWLMRITRRGVLKVTLGHPPSMSLPVARKVAKAALADHLAGIRIDADWIEAQHEKHRIKPPFEVYKPFVEPPPPWTWSQAAAVWLHSLDEAGRSPVTVASYRKALMQVLGDLRDRPVVDVSAQDAQAALDAVADRYPALAEQVLKTVRPFSKWLSSETVRDRSGVAVHRYKRLVLPPPETRTPRGWQTVSLESVARLVAIARLGVLSEPVSRALEVILWTGLPRSAVVPTRRGDIRDGVWTVRPELLKRKDAIRIPLHGRLQELLSGGDDTWVFPQPRRPRRGAPSHLPVEGLGRATWELPGVPTATEAGLAMRDHLQRHGSSPLAVQDLTDSGGDDDRLDDEGGAPLWVRRGWLLADWHAAVEPLVAEQAAGLDPVEIKTAMRARRPYKG